MNRKDLANKIWHACDIMRRDDGTTGVLEYMEQLSWLIFLKIFEDLEKRFEDEAQFEGKEYTPIIDPEYRWSAWATKSDKELEKYFTSEELKAIRDSNEHILIAFIDRKLFPYLRSLKGTPEKEKIASIFQEITGIKNKSEAELVQATMKQIGNPEKLVIVFNDFIHEDSGKNEQAGLTYIAEGIFRAFRNPKGHEPEDHPSLEMGPYEALDQLITIDYIWRRIERAKINKSRQKP